MGTTSVACLFGPACSTLGRGRRIVFIASTCNGLEFKPQLGGHGDKAQYNRGVLYGTKALTSNRMLPHCGYEGLSTLGLKQ